MISEIVACFDDSGTDAGNPSRVVAGFAGCADQWRVFDTEWSEVCEEFGVVRFKAKEFNDGLRGVGQYGQWTRDRHEGFLNRLLTVIRGRTSQSFATLVDKQAYQGTIAPQKDLVEYFYSPFAFASFNCIHQVCDWRNASLAGAPIGFYFDRGARNEGQLNDVAKRVLIGPDRAVEDVKFADDAICRAFRQRTYWPLSSALRRGTASLDLGPTVAILFTSSMSIRTNG